MTAKLRARPLAADTCSPAPPAFGKRSPARRRPSPWYVTNNPITGNLTKGTSGQSLVHQSGQVLAQVPERGYRWNQRRQRADRLQSGHWHASASQLGQRDRRQRRSAQPSDPGHRPRSQLSGARHSHRICRCRRLQQQLSQHSWPCVPRSLHHDLDSVRWVHLDRRRPATCPTYRSIPSSSTRTIPARSLLGTDFGLYYTDDITANPPVWNRFNNGLPNVMIWDMSVDRGSTTLALWTRSRGAYAWPLPTGPEGGPAGPATMSTPAPSSTLTGSSVNFTWYPSSAAPGLLARRGQHAGRQQLLPVGQPANDHPVADGEHTAHRRQHGLRHPLHPDQRQLGELRIHLHGARRKLRARASLPHPPRRDHCRGRARPSPGVRVQAQPHTGSTPAAPRAATSTSNREISAMFSPRTSPDFPPTAAPSM